MFGVLCWVDMSILAHFKAQKQKKKENSFGRLLVSVQGIPQGRERG